MTKWILALLALITIMGTLVWQLSSDSPRVVVKVEDAQVPSVAEVTTDPPKTGDSRKSVVAKSDPEGNQEPEGDKELDPQSEEFSHNLDVTIPDGLRAILARCPRQGVDPDAKISIRYQLHISNGIASVSQATATKSDLDTELERCMVSAVEHARLEVGHMPDFSEEQDLFIRIRSLNKYLSKEEQEQAKERDKEP
jgi:hypothetical protein